MSGASLVGKRRGTAAAATTAQPHPQAAHETHRHLIHDDPVDWTAVGCDCLAEALIAQQRTTLALSQRLVQGIQQVVHKQQQQQQDEEECEHGQRDAAMARLAWTVHIRLPLACLQHPARAAAYLGSYRVLVSAAAAVEHENAVEAVVSALHDPISQMSNGKTASMHLSHSDSLFQHGTTPLSSSSPPPSAQHDEGRCDDELEHDNSEIWAEESDPSDFVFESGQIGIDYQAAQLQELDQWAIWAEASMDPVELSKQPPPAEGIGNNDDDGSAEQQLQLAHTISHLLQTVLYSPHLVALPDAWWTNNNTATSCGDCWTVLILYLLVPTASPNHAILAAMATAWLALVALVSGCRMASSGK
jgi:hypothetical protein